MGGGGGVGEGGSAIVWNKKRSCEFDDWQNVINKYLIIVRL